MAGASIGGIKMRCERCGKKLITEPAFNFRVKLYRPEEDRLLGRVMFPTNIELEFTLCQSCYTTFKKWLEQAE